MTDKRIGLYIHIPFCRKRCDYCDFVSSDDKNELMQDYVDCLVKQMQSYAPYLTEYAVDSVYLGGGTPSALPVNLLEKILITVRENVVLTKNCEITCEANPHPDMNDKLERLKRAGVNRISLGVQTACRDELDALGRNGRVEWASDTVSAARKAGILNISLDIMYSIPNQTTESLNKTLQFAINQNPCHISAYALKIAQGTPLYKRKNDLILPDEDGDIAFYRQCIDTLAEAGFRQYEISNFSKPGYESRHNLKYWHCEEYLGLGCGAHSYFGGKRFCFISDIEEFIKRVLAGKPVVEESMEIPKGEMVEEYIILRLRLCEGIDPVDFEKRFGFPFKTAFSPQIERFTKSGHMEVTNGRYHLTFEGFTISNYILAAFLED